MGSQVSSLVHQSSLKKLITMQFVLLLIAVVAMAQAAPQGGALPADLQGSQMAQYLDDPAAAEELIQCLSDFGASAGITCPEGLRRAQQLAGSLGAQGGCQECTPQENQEFADFQAALAQRPQLLQRFVQVFLPTLSN